MINGRSSSVELVGAISSAVRKLGSKDDGSGRRRLGKVVICEYCL